MDRTVEEEILRIVGCSVWPEFTFTVADIRKPIAEKFRGLLLRFLNGFLGCRPLNVSSFHS